MDLKAKQGIKKQGMHNKSMEECVFCKLAKGQIPATKVYEDTKTLAFLDIYPSAKGHTLVIPKKHYPTLLEIPELELKELIAVVQKTGAAVMKGTSAQGFNVIQNNKEAAGQVIHHIHFHIIPRTERDGLKFSLGSRKAEQKELEEYQKIIKNKLEKI